MPKTARFASLAVFAPFRFVGDDPVVYTKLSDLSFSGPGWGDGARKARTLGNLRVIPMGPPLPSEPRPDDYNPWDN